MPLVTLSTIPYPQPPALLPASPTIPPPSRTTPPSSPPVDHRQMDSRPLDSEDPPTPSMDNRQLAIENPPSLRDFLPPGQITLLIGDPGAGKSLIALDLASRLSRRQPLPPHPTSLATSPLSPHAPPPRPCFLLAYEDPATTLLARFQANHADLNSICVINPRVNLTLYKADPLEPGPPSKYSSLIDCLDQKIHHEKLRPSILIIDPLPAALGPQDSYFAPTLRRLLDPLLRFAAAYHFPILGITHLAKPTSANKHPLHRIRGSQAYPALARSILYVTHSQTPTLHSLDTPAPPFNRLLIPIKNTLRPLDRAFPFTILPNSSLLWSREPLLSHPLLRDGQPLTPTPPDPLQQDRALFRQTQIDFAKSFLHTTLAAGPVLSTTLLRLARDAGITSRTLARARYELNIPTVYNGEERKWYISISTSGVSS